MFELFNIKNNCEIVTWGGYLNICLVLSTGKSNVLRNDERVGSYILSHFFLVKVDSNLSDELVTVIRIIKKSSKSSFHIFLRDCVKLFSEFWDMFM